MFEAVAPLVVNGLANAALIFFVAVGLTLVFSVLRVLNVAHGSFYAIGAYVAAISGLWVVGAHWAPYLTFPALLLSAVLVAAIVGPLIERGLVRWTYRKPVSVQILVTFGLFLILEDFQRLVFGVQAYYAPTPMNLLGNSTIAGVVYPNYQLMLVGLAIVVVIGLRQLMRRTRFGKLIVAVVADRETARSQGINADRVYVVAFTLGTFLAALGGALASPTAGIAPGIGSDAVVLAFAVATIGGLGQIEGAAIAAVIVGIAGVVAVFYAPELQAVVPYLVMLAVLLIRPYGLFGSHKARRI